MAGRTDSAGVAIRIELEGPFFGRTDPGDTLYTNIGHMMEGFAEEMEAAVKGDVAAHGYAHASAVKGYTTSVRTGKHWATWAAVGVPNTGSAAEAIRTQAIFRGRHKGNRGTTKGIEGQWHPFRRTKSAVYRMRALASADLAKGMN